MEKKVKNFFPKNKANWGAKWNKKMGGRSFVITCGAFKDTLLRRANTEPSVDFRRANMEPSMDFRKANTEPSMHFRRANTETYYK